MKHVKLTKLSDNIGGLRSPDVTGTCLNLPEIGKRFLVIGPPFEYGNLRYVSTSVVGSLEVLDNIIAFTTENSLYSLEILDD